MTLTLRLYEHLRLPYHYERVAGDDLRAGRNESTSESNGKR